MTASSWITRWAPLIAPGAAILDVAAGGGRHTRHLRGRGHPVTAVDRDISGLADLRGDPGAEIIAADLEDGSPWPLPGRRFGAVVVTNYLHRPLWPALLAALAPGGVLLYETFMVGNERFGKPGNPAFLLRDGELLDVAREGGLSVVAYEAVMLSDPRPAMVQRIAARRF
ncbi:MAG: class I SAM-dependent methyltransferase [Alphaproteobacteria bacterium]|nr:class I SAM-dependent methyltransferase [Alphaproteobacteria bacterium]MCW5742796.1 class I SAM-dependent methyltransferase [Alphaproteobacteria bacterium]